VPPRNSAVESFLGEYSKVISPGSHRIDADDLNKTRPSCPERAGWFVGWLLVLGWELFEGLVQDGLGRRPLLLRGFGQLLVGLPGNLRFRNWFLSPLFELFMWRDL
jgi:hypothetical protein